MFTQARRLVAGVAVAAGMTAGMVGPAAIAGAQPLPRVTHTGGISLYNPLYDPNQVEETGALSAATFDSADNEGAVAEMEASSLQLDLVNPNADFDQVMETEQIGPGGYRESSPTGQFLPSAIAAAEMNAMP